MKRAITLTDTVWILRTMSRLLPLFSNKVMDAVFLYIHPNKFNF